MMKLQRVTLVLILYVLFGTDASARKNIPLEETNRAKQGKSLDLQKVQGYLNNNNTLVFDFPKTYGEVEVIIADESNNQIIYQETHLVVAPLLSLTVCLPEPLPEGSYSIHIETKTSVIDGVFEVE